MERQRQVHARLFVDKVLIPCNELRYSMMVPTTLCGKPDHYNRSVLVDAYINVEDPVVEPVLNEVKNLFNRFSGAMGTGKNPELRIKVEFDDDDQPGNLLAGFEFNGKIHNYNLVKVLDGVVPSGVKVFHIHIAALPREKIYYRN
jgi:hypothetical protein